jgi:hypothetical protein
MLAISKIQISISGKSPGILSSSLTKSADGELSTEKTLAPSLSPTKVVLFSASWSIPAVRRKNNHEQWFASAHVNKELQESIRTTGAVVMGRRTFEIASDPDS